MIAGEVAPAPCAQDIIETIPSNMLRAPYIDRLLETRSSPHLHLGLFPRDRPTIDLDAAAVLLDERVVEAAGIRAGERVLDVACGFGGTLARLARDARAPSLTGLNIDPRQLEIARATTPEDVLLVHADACAMPFRADAFDRVLCIEAAFHFASRERFLAEAARVCAPGGRIVITDFEPTEAARAISDRRRARLEQRLAGAIGVIGDAARAEPYEALAEQVGLEVIHREELTAATLPSYPAMLHGLRGAHPPWPRSIVRGLRLLAAAGRLGALPYVLVAFEPSAGRVS